MLRILDVQSQPLSFDALGMPDKELAQLKHAIHRPNGMVLITGPTGSGKTVTLYTCLNHLNSPSVNIATVEDPSEIVLPGANQINVNERIGLTFDVALRALLRQDPDILMVGEIRDFATADMAVKASQTGHLVLSTLHTNDAASTLTRLNHMGIAGFNVASSVVLICAQRLLRRLCDACKQPLPDQAGYKAVGCPQCLDGYAGRIAIHQVMPITPSLQPLLLQQVSAGEIAAQAAREGVRHDRRGVDDAVPDELAAEQRRHLPRSGPVGAPGADERRLALRVGRNVLEEPRVLFEQLLEVGDRLGARVQQRVHDQRDRVVRLLRHLRCPPHHHPPIPLHRTRRAPSMVVSRSSM